jgi:hypothetical protein
MVHFRQGCEVRMNFQEVWGCRRGDIEDDFVLYDLQGFGRLVADAGTSFGMVDELMMMEERRRCE